MSTRNIRNAFFDASAQGKFLRTKKNPHKAGLTTGAGNGSRTRVLALATLHNSLYTIPAILEESCEPESHPISGTLRLANEDSHLTA